MSLEDFQRAFADALRRPAKAALAAGHFAESSDIVERRLALYRGNVIANACRALEAAYPVVRRIVGESFFEGLARAYWQAEPARGGDLNDYGAGLARFAASFAPCAALPYLTDVTRLEWRVHLAHFAADAKAFEVAMLARIAEPELATLALHPAASLLATAHPAATIWNAHRADATPGALQAALAGSAEQIVVARPQFRVAVHRIDPARFAWLAALAEGRPLGAASAEALRVDPSFDLGATLVEAQRWGVLAAPGEAPSAPAVSRPAPARPRAR